MRKTGKTAQDIFAPTIVTSPTKTIERSGPGRPPIHEEDWTKVTVVLYNRQIVFLDRLANDIRANTGAAISRAEIVRALIDVLAGSEIDVTTATSEDDLKTIITTGLSKLVRA